jgi:hypothetical protein
MWREPRGERHRFARKPRRMQFGGGCQALHRTAQALDREFDGVTLAGRQACPRTAGGKAVNFRNARRPCPRPGQGDECIERMRIERWRPWLHG